MQFDPHAPHGQHNKDEQRNLIIAIALSALAVISFEVFGSYVFPREDVSTLQQEAAPAEVAKTQAPQPDAQEGGAPSLPQAQRLSTVNTDAALSEGVKINVEIPRVPLEGNALQGSLSARGARLDRLSLPEYKINLNEDEPVTLFRASGANAHFFDAGWLGNADTPAPDGNTVWRLAAGNALAPESPVTFSWQNGNGQVFERSYTLSSHKYVITVTDSVLNNAERPVTLTSYAQIHKTGVEQGGTGFEQSNWLNYFGPIGWADGLRLEAPYHDLHDADVRTTARDGWLGISSRYFVAALTTDNASEKVMQFRHSNLNERDFYTAMLQPAGMVLQPGQREDVVYHLYVGPKAVEPLQALPHGLEKAVDYGWFHVLAAPLHWLTLWLYEYSGNMGIAIILTTVLLKIALFPLAQRSYMAMAKMKRLQPRMEEMKERYGDDRESFAKNMMALYAQEKVNPMSGCWPMLIQIPIFFAFYKMILVSFEFRHAPFIGWIHDLSVMDPYYVLPIIMGVTMMIQMRLQPSATDPIQQKVLQWMPVLFTFFCFSFPAGLVLYWIVNNTLSAAQQYLMIRRYS